MFTPFNAVVTQLWYKLVTTKCFGSSVTFTRLRKTWSQTCIRIVGGVKNKMNVLTLFLSGTKLQWSSAITLAVFVWLFTAFWSAMPLIGWGEYDYEPLRTCCTLDYSKGDRYCLHAYTPNNAIKINTDVFVFYLSHWEEFVLSLLCVYLSTETMCPSWSPWASSTWPSRCLLSCPLTNPLHRNSRRLETLG